MQNDKPIIRDCRNCKCGNPAEYYGAWCKVRKRGVNETRLRALFCRYYKAKGGVDNAG